MRLTRHDYDLMQRIHEHDLLHTRLAFAGQPEKLEAGNLVTVHSSGNMTLTAYGRRQLQRVRGVGQGLFKVPPGYALVPLKITPEMLEAAREYGPNFTAGSYRNMLSRAPKVTP